MANYLGFIDETGVLSNDPGQPFFAIGLLECEDVSVLYEELWRIKNQIESKLGLERNNRGLSAKGICFEFKFSNITGTSYKFYCDLIDLYFRFPSLKFCSLVIDKKNPNVKIDEVFSDTWEAYIGYSKMLIKNNINGNDSICILADFLGKPRASNKYYEPEIRTLANVYNASFIESHASLFIQLVDLLIGCVVLDFRRSKEGKKVDEFKAKVCDYLKTKLGVQTLAKNFTKHAPNYFSVWEFRPIK
ncbi:MAG: DUF3800 domain-containing protein [Candidatus Woesebacteria bacterium]|nr:DUF3800 domain-containing protein [Candidatus Woesebacteria bacterium]